jgi:hypothetical protein
LTEWTQTQYHFIILFQGIQQIISTCFTPSVSPDTEYQNTEMALPGLRLGAGMKLLHGAQGIIDFVRPVSSEGPSSGIGTVRDTFKLREEGMTSSEVGAR